MKHYFKFEPVRTLAALGMLSQSVILLLAFLFSWDVLLLGLVEGIQTAVLVLLSTFVRGAVTPVAALEALRELPKDDLAKWHYFE
jgi:hypothetical protein